MIQNYFRKAMCVCHEVESLLLACYITYYKFSVAMCSCFAVETCYELPSTTTIQHQLISGWEGDSYFTYSIPAPLFLINHFTLQPYDIALLLNISPWQRGLSDWGNCLIGRVAFLFFHKLFKHYFLSLIVVLRYEFYKQFNIYNNVRVPPA